MLNLAVKASAHFVCKVNFEGGTILPTRMEKKKTPVIQQQVMKHLSMLLVGLGFLPMEVAVLVAK